MAKKTAKTPTPAQKTEKPVVEKATEPVVSTEPANDVVEATTETGFSELSLSSPKSLISLEL